MRAIAGIVRFDQGPVAPGEIDEVMRRMALGRIDRQSSFAEGAVGMGHLIQFLSDEDHFENQPMRSADGNLLMVADAYLDNRAELVQALGVTPIEEAALADGGLVFLAFQRWGEDCPSHLEGKFAFAAWNGRERRLFCAVDAFSMRPLYYVKQGSRFAFATTLRGIFAIPGVSRQLNDGVLADSMLTQPADFGETLYRDIRIIPAATRLWVDGAGVKLEPYWEPNLARRVRFRSTEEYVEAFSHEFRRAIEPGLRTRRNVGIMVSGGLDSAAATAVAGKLFAERGRRLQAIHQLPQRGTTDPRRTRLRDPDESPWVRTLQEHAPHIDFHYRERRPGKISLELWDKQFEENLVPTRGIVTGPSDEPAPEYPDLNLGRLLYGLGGNYVVSLECGGNSYLPQLLVRGHWMRLMREMRGRRDVYGIGRKRQVRGEFLEAFLKPFKHPYEPRYEMLPCLNPDFVRSGGFVRRIRGPRQFLWDPKDFNTRLQRKWIMTDLMPQHVGSTGSVVGSGYNCEGHLPYFDRRLNEFCLAVPLEQQIDGGWDRLLLRRAMKGLLPDKVAWRISRGFPSVGLWEASVQMREVLPEALAEMRKSSLVAAYLNLDELEKQYGNASGGKGNWMAAKRLNDLFCVGWFLRWLERARF